MPTASEIQVLISAQTEELQAGMQRAAAAVETSTSQIDAAFISANEAVETFEASLKALQNVAVFAVFIEGAQKIREMVSSVNENEVALLHMSEHTGVAVGELHGLSVALEATGASGSSFERAMRMLEVQLERAAMGSASAQEKFAALGLNWQSLRGLNAEQLFLSVADAVSNMREGTDKAGAVIGLLGARFGTQLIPALNMGADGLKQIIALENELNPITQQAAEDAAKLHVQQLALGESSNSLARSMSHELRGALSEVYTEVLNLEGAFIEIKTFLAEGGLTSWSFSGIKKAFDDADAAGLAFVAHATEMAAALSKVQAAGQEAPPDVATLKPEGSAESTYANSESVLMTQLEARQRAIKEEAEEELRIWTEAAKSVESVEMSKFALEAEQIKSAGALHQITKQQETDALIELDKRELASKLTTIQNEIAALQQAGAAEKDYYDKIAALQAQAEVLQNQYAAKIVALQTQAATQSASAWNQFGSSISGQFNSVVSQLTTGTATLQSIMRTVFGGITQDFTRMILEMVAQTALFKTIEAAITGMFGAIGPAANAAAATSAAANVAEATSAAGLAGANMMASFSAAPWPIDMGASAAAAAAYAEAMGFAGAAAFEMGGIVKGGNFGIPIIAHAGEAVLPARMTEFLLDAASRASDRSGSSGGGDHYAVSVNLSINAIDGASVEALFKQGRVKDLIGEAVFSKIRDARHLSEHRLLRR